MLMSRLVNDDFDGLEKFVTTYALAPLAADKEFLGFLSSLHKKFYSYLVLIEELRLCVDDKAKKPVLSKDQFDYLQESVSDCGQCLFMAIHGCYKGTRLLLRSSIENFIKGISLDVAPQIVIEKSVYQVFDDADVVEVFQKTTLKSDIHNIYGTLCMDVHTADSKHMAGVSALKYFPHFAKEDAKKLSNVYVKLLSMFVTSLCLKYNSQFHAISYQNKEVVSAALIDDMKTAVYGE